MDLSSVTPWLARGQTSLQFLQCGVACPLAPQHAEEVVEWMTQHGPIMDYWVSKMERWPELAHHVLQVLGLPAPLLMCYLKDCSVQLGGRGHNRQTHLPVQRQWGSLDLYQNEPGLDYRGIPHPYGRFR